jgi:hypothetical protein
MLTKAKHYCVNWNHDDIAFTLQISSMRQCQKEPMYSKYRGNRTQCIATLLIS